MGLRALGTALHQRLRGLVRLAQLAALDAVGDELSGGDNSIGIQRDRPLVRLGGELELLFATSPSSCES